MNATTTPSDTRNNMDTKLTVLKGFSITTESGTQVWLGKSKQGFVIKLKSMEGRAEVLTTLHVSDGAMSALVSLHAKFKTEAGK